VEEYPNQKRRNDSRKEGVSYADDKATCDETVQGRKDKVETMDEKMDEEEDKEEKMQGQP